jgi:CMP-N-acetylneuraminic acid synthetase
MKVLGIIPARGGSKGVPRKNIKMLCGKPLVAYTIESALCARKLARTVLSTEDQEIAEVGMSYGIDVPFLRPREFSEDSSPTLPVIQHVLEMLDREGEHFDAVCLLQPTSPLRRSVDIDNCILLLERNGADSVVSVLPVPPEHNPYWVYWKSEGGRMSLAMGDDEPIPRRQDLPAAFHREGSVYVTRTHVVTAYGSLYGEHVLGYEMLPEFSSNIDTPEDWLEVEARLAARGGERDEADVSVLWSASAH